jgi:hypothetical protein
MTKIKTLLAGSAAIAALAISAPASADQVILDDLIVQGSTCIGLDCVNGENFSFDTLRLKENNLRIHFDDTSVSASFPRNDWRIIANASENSGDSFFSIQDATARRRVFTVEAGAPQAALFVEDTGDVGIGTGTPNTDLNIHRGDSPTIRLQQDGSSGFTPQTWDMAGNETNFFVRDVTSGSLLPFRIRPGAPTSSIDVTNTGNVGIGLAAASASLHVARRDGTATVRVDEQTGTRGKRTLLELANNGNPQILMSNTGNGNDWVIGAGNTFNLEHTTTSTGVMEIDSSGNMSIPGTLTTGGGTCGGGCDAVFTAAYALPSIEEHSAAMWSNGYLPNVGPTVEGEAINVSDKMGRMLNELETAHVYIDQLNGELADQRAETEALRAEFEARLAALEAGR